MMTNLLRALGIKPTPKPAFVTQFEEASNRLTSELQKSDPFGELMHSMARPSRRKPNGNGSTKKK